MHAHTKKETKTERDVKTSGVTSDTGGYKTDGARRAFHNFFSRERQQARQTEGRHEAKAYAQKIFPGHQEHVENMKRPTRSICSPFERSSNSVGVCACACACASACVCVCVHVCLCACVHVHVYVHVCVCVSILKEDTPDRKA